MIDVGYKKRVRIVTPVKGRKYVTVALPYEVVQREAEKRGMKVDDFVKVCLEEEDKNGERFWCQVKKIDPANRFDKIERERDLEHLEWDQEYLTGLNERHIEYLADDSKSIISENNSPDIPFRYSINPYRGCIHGYAC